MQSIPHLFPDCRLSSAGAEHQGNQAKYVTMRQENQPSLTGLVLLGIVPSTGSALYLRFHSGQLACAEPYWAIIRSSLRDFTLQTAVATPGLERNAHRTEPCACDPALISRPAAPRRAVGQSLEKCRNSRARLYSRAVNSLPLDGFSR